jgi:UPF0176 protein
MKVCPLVGASGLDGRWLIILSKPYRVNTTLQADRQMADEVEEMGDKCLGGGNEESDGYTVAALYCFTSLNDLEAVEATLRSLCLENNIKGGLIIAREGVNGTIAGKAKSIAVVTGHLRADPLFADIDIKYSHTAEQPFYRLRSQLKNEIVTLGVDGVDPTHSRGTYIQPEAWNDLISDPNTIVFDTRNDYEVAIGTFQRAINPQTKIFREFPEYISQELPKHRHEDGTFPKIAMFCTGGIRCEKASAYLKDLGYPEVYHLKGGILNYLEKIPQEESLWKGECYVFDQRVSVGHGVTPGTYIQCRSCRMPLSSLEASELSPPPPEGVPEQFPGPYFEDGVFCRYCFTKLTRTQIEAARERNKQIHLSKERQEEHLGYHQQKIRKPQKMKYRWNKAELKNASQGGEGGIDGLVSTLFEENEETGGETTNPG